MKNPVLSRRLANARSTRGMVQIPDEELAAIRMRGVPLDKFTKADLRRIIAWLLREFNVIRSSHPPQRRPTVTVRVAFDRYGPTLEGIEALITRRLEED